MKKTLFYLTMIMLSCGPKKDQTESNNRDKTVPFVMNFFEDNQLEFVNQELVLQKKDVTIRSKSSITRDKLQNFVVANGVKFIRFFSKEFVFYCDLQKFSELESLDDLPKTNLTNFEKRWLSNLIQKKSNKEQNNAETILEDIKYRRNTIYAIKGRTFTNKEIQSYFEFKSWYLQNYEYHDSLLNKFDLEEIEILRSVENNLKLQVDTLILRTSHIEDIYKSPMLRSYEISAASIKIGDFSPDIAMSHVISKLGKPITMSIEHTLQETGKKEIFTYYYNKLVFHCYNDIVLSIDSYDETLGAAGISVGMSIDDIQQRFGKFKNANLTTGRIYFESSNGSLNMLVYADDGVVRLIILKSSVAG